MDGAPSGANSMSDSDELVVIVLLGMLYCRERKIKCAHHKSRTQMHAPHG